MSNSIVISTQAIKTIWEKIVQVYFSIAFKYVKGSYNWAEWKWNFVMAGCHVKLQAAPVQRPLWKTTQ